MFRMSLLHSFNVLFPPPVPLPFGCRHILWRKCINHLVDYRYLLVSFKTQVGARVVVVGRVVGGRIQWMFLKQYFNTDKHQNTALPKHLSQERGCKNKACEIRFKFRFEGCLGSFWWKGKDPSILGSFIYSLFQVNREIRSSEHRQKLPLHNRKQPLSPKANKTNVPNLIASWEKKKRKKNIRKKISSTQMLLHIFYSPMPGLLSNISKKPFLTKLSRNQND